LHCCAADLFAVGYGSFDVQRQGMGAVLCFSFKDPATPVFERQTASGELLFAPVLCTSHLLRNNGNAHEDSGWKRHGTSALIWFYPHPANPVSQCYSR